eukprot:TRINITY_DN10279_c0_g1_i1.p1 TRINITY_DN10279_c0_g1~~TRINITY_DN10279_c0_g1_i1.p1  ORF type:complete len:201 (+),score=46.38 TRINITY_DN10279_c0_g1_i1:89-604(+)
MEDDDRAWWNVIGDTNIILGAIPMDKDFQTISELEVGGVLSMLKDYEFEPNLYGTPVSKDIWGSVSIAHKQLETQDFGAPQFESLLEGVEFIDEIISSGKNCYVHCKAGRGRSTCITVCYLLFKYGDRFTTVEEAIRYVKFYRNHINMGTEQCSAVHNFFNQIKLQGNGED